MNEFEWLQQTRALNQPVPPRTELWPNITQRIHAPAAPQPARPPRLLPWAMAAALAAVSVLAGWLALRQQVIPSPRVAITRSVPADIAPWKPRDPRLVGAAIELNIARRQLTMAIQRAPNDAFLQHMLEHTNQQIHRLQHFEQRAG